jgi:hypothetical protein
MDDSGKYYVQARMIRSLLVSISFREIVYEKIGEIKRNSKKLHA